MNKPLLGINRSYYESPIGLLEITADSEKVLSIMAVSEKGEYTSSALTQQTVRELKEYFSGIRRVFSVPVEISGTTFQKKVYNALVRIPYRETVSYGKLAELAGSPKASRAVGQAVHRNPLLILVPCHRVISADGSLGGFALGTDIKKQLLKLERDGNVMKELTLVSSTAEETRKIGERLAPLLGEGSLLTLNGELGAGKTTFTQGLAKGLGITRNVTSPTFTILKSYKGDLPLYHIDAYRLEDISQDLGFEEYMDSDGVCVIEWSGFISDILPEERLEAVLTINDDDTRTIAFKAYGERYEEVLEKLCTL